MRLAFQWFAAAALLSSAAFPEAAFAEDAHVFRDGKFEGRARTYFMATQNDGALKDWYAWALGGRLGYHTAPYHGFGGGVAAYASRALISNHDEVDATTQRPSRFEIGLFNYDDRRDKEVALVGEAYVDFRDAGHEFWAGRHLLKTPLLNPQDGRMIPTLAQGLWYGYQSPFGLGVQGGYLSHIAARGAERFRRVGQSVGTFPAGRNVDGTPSEYPGNTDSAGLFVASVSYKHELFSVNAWDYHTDNVFNALYTDAYFEPHFLDLDWRLGGQYIMEHRVADGGSPQPEQAYFQDKRSNTFGGHVQAQTQDKWLVSANYNRITSAGRFLFPREWGREPLFVFQKRERSEGAGDLDAVLLELGKTWGFEEEGELMTKLGYGQYYLPDPTQPELNKYAMPSYRQVNLDTFFTFAGALEGLVAEVLVSYKGQLGSLTSNPAFVQNKVDMWHWNLIANYSF